MKYKALILSLFVAIPSQASDIKTSHKGYSVKIGSSRIIYKEKSKGASVIVVNPEDYPVLIQSTVYGEDKSSPGSFIVTPPIFRLEAQVTSRLKLIRKGNELPQDKESMEWLCVKGIPPVDSTNDDSVDGAAEVIVQISMNTCNKILYRPSGLQGEMIDFAGEVKWKRNGESIVGINNSPYYINISELKVGGKEFFNPQYIKPFSEKSFGIRGAGVIEWKVITDNGGESKLFRSGS